MITTRHIILSLIILFSASCANYEEPEQSHLFDGERISMNVHVGLKEAVTDDNTIASVRVIVFDEKNRLVYNQKTVPTALADVYTVAAECAHGFNSFYIFCNEPADLTQKLATITDQTQIEKLTFEAAGLTPPLPMYAKVARAFVSARTNGSEPRVAIGNDTYDHLPAKVTRMVAKISFMAIKKINTPEEDFVVEELRIRVNRMPAYTTVAEDVIYTGSKWLSNVTAIGEGKLDGNNDGYTYDPDTKIGTPTAGQDVITFPDLYIPEYLLEVEADRSKATFLTVDAACRMKNGSTQLIHSTYQVLIGQEPPKTYNLRRNNHYRIYATITGMGAMGIYAEIQAMDRYDMAINWKPIDGLVIVSDRAADYDTKVDTCRNVNIWNDYTVYSGILKTYHSATGYHEMQFKYGSLIGVHTEWKATDPLPFEPPVSESDLGNIHWYPASYGNPYAKIRDWASVPFIPSGADIPVKNDRVREGLGDPCKLVGLSAEQIGEEGIVDNKQWHMATPKDYETLLRAADNVSDAQGYRAFHALLVPNVKTRDASGVLAAAHGGKGSYWTTTLSSAFAFTSSDPATPAITPADPNMAMAVRCVRNEIPTTELGVDKSPSISYQGNIITGSPFVVTSNIPHWTATLVDDPLDSEVGTSRDFDDFSFAPGAGTKVHQITGSYGATVPIYLPRKESQSSRSFRIRVTGMGYDGVTETVHVTATQSGYTLRAVPIFEPNIDDKNSWIPAIGGTYKVKLKLYPLDVAIPAGYLTTVVSYHGGVLNQTTSVATSPGIYEYDGGELIIPDNTTPNPIGIQFQVFLTNNPNPDPASAYSIGEYYALQHKK